MCVCVARIVREHCLRFYVRWHCMSPICSQIPLLARHLSTEKIPEKTVWYALEVRACEWMNDSMWTLIQFNALLWATRMPIVFYGRLCVGDVCVSVKMGVCPEAQSVG